MIIRENTEKIKMIISDFDGIFTDGTGIVDCDGNVSKRIHFHDVIGIALAIKAGYIVVIMTGEAAGAVKYLDKKFPELTVYQDIKDKLPLVMQIAQENNISKEELLYIGDDVNDYLPLNYAGIKVTVPNANQNVKEIKDIHLTEKKGGEGVFREVADALIGSKLGKLLVAGEK